MAEVRWAGELISEDMILIEMHELEDDR